jgi:L-lactate permease
MRDRITMVVAATISVFVLLSLVFTFILAVRGQETGGIWGQVFDLVAVLVGAIGGYIAGSQIQKARDDHDADTPPAEPVELEDDPSELDT